MEKNNIKVILDPELGSIKAAHGRPLPICTVKKGKKKLECKVGLANFGTFDDDGCLKDNLLNNVLIEPVYDIIIGEIIESDDIVALGRDVRIYSEKNGSDFRRYYYLFKYDDHYPCKAIKFETIAKDVCISNDRKLVTITNLEGEFGAIDWKQQLIAPFGKYDWIDQFKGGLARVKIGKETNGHISDNIKWGLIDVTGKEVLPIIYDNLYFETSYRINATIERRRKIISLAELSYDTYNSVMIKEKLEEEKLEEERRKYSKSNNDNTYGEYDYNKAAREQLGDAYDGEPDAYWNTD